MGTVILNILGGLLIVLLLVGLSVATYFGIEKYTELVDSKAALELELIEKTEALKAQKKYSGQVYDLYNELVSKHNELIDRFKVELDSKGVYESKITELNSRLHILSLKKSKTIDAIDNRFSYTKIPSKSYSLGLSSTIDDNAFFIIATPWKALADLIYTTKKNWHDLQELMEDLRIEEEKIKNSDIELLKLLINL